MKIVGISMVKDEADIIEYTVSNMLNQVDEVWVLDNGSTDGTGDILHDLGVHVIHDPVVGYYQSFKMTELANSIQTDWIVPFDADEYWCTKDKRTIKETLSKIPADYNAVEACLFDYVSTSQDSNEHNPIKRIKWRRRFKAPLSKVAFRPKDKFTINQGNHSVSHEQGTVALEDVLVVKHFPYRSAEQFLNKVRNGSRAYTATDLSEDVGAHWRQYGYILESDGEEAVKHIYRTWFWSLAPEIDATLVYDPI